MKPEELLYAETHEWVHVEDADGGKLAVVGISAFALEALTDLVFIDLPEAGRRVEAGKPMGEVESVKAVSDIYSPVDGEVVESHGDLADQLQTLGQDPYGEGWLVKIRADDESALARLMDYRAYRKQCEKEDSED